MPLPRRPPAGCLVIVEPPSAIMVGEGYPIPDHLPTLGRWRALSEACEPARTPHRPAIPIP
jgi:hypothetical protein